MPRQMDHNRGSAVGPEGRSQTRSKGNGRAGLAESSCSKLVRSGTRSGALEGGSGGRCYSAENRVTSCALGRSLQRQQEGVQEQLDIKGEAEASWVEARALQGRLRELQEEVHKVEEHGRLLSSWEAWKKENLSAGAGSGLQLLLPDCRRRRRRSGKDLRYTSRWWRG